MKINTEIIARQYQNFVIKGHHDINSWSDFSEDFLTEHIRDIKGRIRYKFIKAEKTWGRWIPDNDPDHESSRFLDMDQKYAHQRGAFPVTEIEATWATTEKL